MIFIDSNVFMYVVGRPHPLREEAREFLRRAHMGNASLCTSAEVLQELIHAYIPADRPRSLDAALSLIDGYGVEVWPLEREDVITARQLHLEHPQLSARDLCHLASCRRRNVREVMTFDRALASVFGSPPTL